MSASKLVILDFETTGANVTNIQIRSGDISKARFGTTPLS